MPCGVRKEISRPSTPQLQKTHLQWSVSGASQLSTGEIVHVLTRDTPNALAVIECCYAQLLTPRSPRPSRVSVPDIAPIHELEQVAPEMGNNL